MEDLDQALLDIEIIRQHLARSSEFRGYGAVAVASTGVVALLVATVQALWLKDLPHHIGRYVMCWVIAAVASFFGVAVEAAYRCRRVHGGLGWMMLQRALEQFVPAIVAGGLLTVVLMRSAPADAWMLPGLWQLLFSTAVFAAWRSLPPLTFAAGAWYLLCGLTCLLRLASDHAISPWAMGIPFGIGQLMIGAILHQRRAMAPELARDPQEPA